MSIDAEFTATGSSLATRPEAPTQFLDAMRPAQKLAFATEMADALKPMLQAKNLVKHLNNKNPDDEYIELEGWQTVAALGGMSCKIEWCRPIEGGFEARAVVVRMDTGIEVGAGESRCTKSEKKWQYRDDYAISGMAQTRAQSRALRGVLAWVTVLAGFKATPAEEMPEYEPAKAPAPRPATKPAASQVEHPQAVAKDQETIPQMSPEEVRGKLEELLRQIPEQRRIKVIGDATNGRAYALDQIKKLGDARAVLASLLGAAEEFDDERASARDGHLFGNTHDGTDIETEVPM